MRSKKSIVSTRTIAFIVVAVLLFASGGIMGARAALNIQSQNYNAEFDLEHLSVQILENGKLTGADNDTTGKLIQYMDGKVKPGYVWDEAIAARNNSDVKEYVRLTIRKYWLDDKGKKATDLDPSLIKLYYGDKKEDYNKSAWQINNDETSTESKTYYLTKVLDGGKDSPPVVDKLVVSDKIMAPENIKKEESKDGDKTTITYTYKYDGYRICLEADVQSVQTHNPDDAIPGIWGVQNVSASGGKLHVSN